MKSSGTDFALQLRSNQWESNENQWRSNESGTDFALQLRSNNATALKQSSHTSGTCSNNVLTTPMRLSNIRPRSERSERSPFYISSGGWREAQIYTRSELKCKISSGSSPGTLEVLLTFPQLRKWFCTSTQIYFVHSMCISMSIPELILHFNSDLEQPGWAKKEERKDERLDEQHDEQTVAQRSVAQRSAT